MKLQLYLLTAIVLFPSPVFAESSLGAHLHGHVKLNVAADGKTLFVEVHSPSESFLGFEHRPKTDKQKSLWTSIKNQWNKKTSELIQVDPSLNCKVTQARMDMHFEEEEGRHHEEHHHDEASEAHHEESHHESEHHNHGKEKPLKGVHSEINAEAKFLCGHEIKDSQLVVRLKEHFPKIEEIEAQVLPNSGVPYSKTLTQEKEVLNL